MTTTITRRRIVALAVALALTASACASDDSRTADGIVLDAAESTTTTEKAAGSQLSSDPPDETEPATSDLESALEAIVLETGVPAVGAALFDGEGPIELAASGVRRRGDTTEVSADDLFHLGSNTKAMTAALLARLAEQDRGITFTTTVAEAFPNISNLDDGYVDVTMAQFLTHTGGAPGDELEIDDSILSMPVVQGRALGAELVLAEAPAYPSGTVSSYSNAGYVIVGAAMEAATGKSWEELMVSEVFAPLEMDSCAFGPPGTDGDIDQPYGHDANGEPAFSDNPPLMGPAGTVHCSMADWGRFLVELLNGSNGTSEYLTQSSIARLFEPASVPVQGFPDGHSAAGWLVLNGPDGPDSVAYYHNGSNTAWFSQAVILPSSGRVVLAVANQEGPGEQATGMAFAALSELEAGR